MRGLDPRICRWRKSVAGSFSLCLIFFRHPDESQGPALGGRKLDSGFRRNDDGGDASCADLIRASAVGARAWQVRFPSALFSFVTLTKVRVQLWAAASWIPAFAGITMGASARWYGEGVLPHPARC